MRVGLVTDFYFPWIGGPAQVVRTLSHGLAARGHSIFLLAPSPTGPAFSEIEGQVQVQRAQTASLPVGYRLRVASHPIRDASRWLDENDLDVVHVHHPFPLSAAALVGARRRGIPVVATNHTIPECSLWGIRQLGPLYSLASVGFGRWITLLLGRADLVATPTESAAAALRKIGYSGTILAISNGVDTSRFSPGAPSVEVAERLGLDGRPVVLYTGRLDAEKQMDVWLRAAARIAHDIEVLFLVGGQGTAREALGRLARRLGIEDRVRFIGYLSDDDYASIHRLATVYFITSPVELQSIATLEAVASGLPVVAVRAGALAELVADGCNGYLVGPGDWDSAAEALSVILRDDHKRAKMAAASREIALRHDLSRTIEAYERLLISAAFRTGGRRIERDAAAG